MGGGRITWGGDLGRLSWRWGWWLFSVAMRWRWNPVTAAVLPLCRDTNRCPLPLPVYPFYPFSSFSPTVSLGFPVDIPGFFCVSQFRSFLSLRSWFLSLSFPPFSVVLFPSYSSFRVTIYRGKGSEVDPAPSHRYPCMGRTSPALLWRRPRWPMEASLAWRVASGFGFNRARGERERGRNKRKRTKTSLPLLRVQGKKEEEQCRLKRHCFVFPPFFFLKMHETASFFLKRVVSFRWKLAPKRQTTSQSFNLRAFCILVLGLRFLQLSL